MTTTLEAGFLAALYANPADKATRLIYADWLEEQGRDQDAFDQRRRLQLMDPLRYEPTVAGKAFDVVGPVHDYGCISGPKEVIERILAAEADRENAWKNRRLNEPTEELCSI